MTPTEPDQTLRALTAALLGSYERTGGVGRDGEHHLPSHRAIVTLLEDLQALVMPGFHGEPVAPDADLELVVGARLDAAARNLSGVIEQTLRFCRHSRCRCEEIWQLAGAVPQDHLYGAVARQVALAYLGGLPRIRELLDTDVQAAFEGDPAATCLQEIILCYPGFAAVLVHRIAHPLYQAGVPLLPRIMAEWAHQRTGVDIHPGARIGASFFIDHGTGVVIGETTTIGRRVKIYQGVTLGALSFPRNPDGTLVKGGKRHPTIGDQVTIYANATILGGETVVGDGAVIGGGVWITSSVAPGTKVLG
jgi:serine O-acetyltransferase